MNNITEEERLLYTVLFIAGAIYTILYKSNGPLDVYNNIFNMNILALMYIPLFLYNLLKIIESMHKVEIIIRYETIFSLIKSRLYILVCTSLRLSIFSTILSSMFLIITDVNIVSQFGFWIMNCVSIFTQLIGWIFIGTIYFVLSQLVKSTRIAYILEVLVFLSIKYILSPLMFGNISGIIPPIWDNMYFYDLNIYDTNKVIYSLATLIVIIIFIYIYKKLLEKNDLTSR